MQRTIAQIVFFVISLANQSQWTFAGIMLTPPGLSAGESYRLVFVTSTTRDAMSSNIDDYNQFVQNAANNGPELQALSWKAIASTSTVSARDNTGTNPNVGAGTRIFSVDGVLIANNNQDFWDGTIANAIFINEFGHSNRFNLIWTGTYRNGSSYTGATLGNTSAVVGLNAGYDVNAIWIENGSGTPSTESYRLYGMSDILTVVPEPSSGFLAGLIATLAFGTARNKFRRTNRSIRAE